MSSAIQTQFLANVSHENVLDDNAWRILIEQRTGMVLPERQYEFFTHKIKHGIQTTGLSAKQYFNLLQHNSQQWDLFVESIMIHETRFFRDIPAMQLVADYMASLHHTLRIWSVACATGEEAWSLAMLAAEVATDNFQVIGTDISQNALSFAQKACYTDVKIQHIPDKLRHKYWHRHNNEWTVNQQLSSNTSFYKLNLIATQLFYFRKVDIIYCQNVLMYFRKFTRHDILNALVASLNIGGMLVLEWGEADWSHPNMQRIQHKEILGYERIR